jgi:hypothetical protein
LVVNLLKSWDREKIYHKGAMAQTRHEPILFHCVFAALASGSGVVKACPHAASLTRRPNTPQALRIRVDFTHKEVYGATKLYKEVQLWESGS